METMEPVKKHKKHKKHKSERKSKYDERTPSLKLILKVNGATPEYGSESPYQINKKSKKKKKKKDKRHRQHKRDRHKHESSLDETSLMEENMQIYYSTMTTSSAISSHPITKPMLPQEKKTFHTLTNVSNITTPESKCETLSPMTPPQVAYASGSNLEAREPRTCVLKLKQSRSPLAKLLDHLLKALEKRDPHQFFAWPVTDDIAPGYSSIITNPMDFSTIRQKIEENKYNTIQDFSDDFQLMCENAIKYNHHETVYNKAARRLLQAGMKLFLPENLIRGCYTVFTKDLTVKELGFDPSIKLEHDDVHSMYSVDSAEADDIGLSNAGDPLIEEKEKREKMKLELDPNSSFEPYVDALTADEILEQVQNAAKEARARLNKRKAISMGFLRQCSDGSTSMKILVSSSEEGLPEKTRKLGEFTGKLEKGTGLLQSFREDRRNHAKMPKSLNYGSFSSFAPTFDTRFSNLTAEESELLLNTYGNEDGVNYATSIGRFSKDSVYGNILANKLLDLLTNGEHSKTMEVLIESEEIKQNEKEVEKYLPDYQKEAKALENVTIDFDQLKSLEDIGVDVNFLKNFESAHHEKDLQTKLNNNSSLIEQLHQTQHDRLSAPIPQHLSLVEKPSKNEFELADQITTNLKNIAKKYQPCSISSVAGIRKAMGMNLNNIQNDYRRVQKFHSENKTIDVDAQEADIQPVVATAELDIEIRQLLGTD